MRQSPCASVQRFVASLVAIVVLPALLGAQSPTATLGGTVVDQTGAVVPDVEVMVLNTETKAERRGLTGREGHFTIALLPPGHYAVRAQRQGFTPAEVSDVVLNVNDQIELRIQLKVEGG